MPDTLVLSNDKSHRLRCVIEREPVVLTVTVPRDSEVDDLKTAIRNRGILLDVARTYSLGFVPLNPIKGVSLARHCYSSCSFFTTGFRVPLSTRAPSLPSKTAR